MTGALRVLLGGAGLVLGDRRGLADDRLLLRADLFGIRFDAAGELDDDALGLVECLCERHVILRHNDS